MPLAFATAFLAAGSWENLVFLAVVAIVGLVRWVSQQTGEAKRKSQSQPKPQGSILPKIPKAPETDEQRVRRFLEALGQPTTAAPPKVSPRPASPVLPTVPRDRRIFSPLPPLTTVPADFSRAEVPSEIRLPEIPSDKTSLAQMPDVASKASATSRAEMTTLGIFPETGVAIRDYGEITTLLKSGRGLRDAIILREIFGPPRGLQSLDEMKIV